MEFLESWKFWNVNTKEKFEEMLSYLLLSKWMISFGDGICLKKSISLNDSQPTWSLSVSGFKIGSSKTLVWGVRSLRKILMYTAAAMDTAAATWMNWITRLLASKTY